MIIALNQLENKIKLINMFIIVDMYCLQELSNMPQEKYLVTNEQINQFCINIICQFFKQYLYSVDMKKKY